MFVKSTAICSPTAKVFTPPLVSARVSPPLSKPMVVFMVTMLSFCVAGCGASSMMSSLPEQPAMMAPTNARAAIVRKFFIAILHFVLVGSLLFTFIMPFVVLQAGSAALVAHHEHTCVLQLDDLRRRSLILFLFYTSFVMFLKVYK